MIRRALSVVALLASSAGALAQPVLVMHSLIDADISADGNKAVGLLFDSQAAEYRIYTWQRGAGHTLVSAPGMGAETVRGSGDMTVLATGLLNTGNWGDLNCFAGYCAFEGSGCTLGDPLPAPSPCSVPFISHRWTSASGWTNLGSLPRTLDGATNRFFGGTRCDSSINSVGDISGDGRYVVGGAWVSGLFNSSGGPDFGLCGDLRAYISDATTGVMNALPLQPDNAGSSRADSVSADGSVITGYDEGPIPSEFGPFDGRRICVWTNGVSTIIDGLSGSSATYPVNGAGTVIVGAPSREFNIPTFNIDDLQLVKWTRQLDNSWTPTALGRPADYFDGVETKPLSFLLPVAVSDDGNTIVGNATFGFSFFDRVNRPFIWRAGVNGGVPMDLNTYLEQIAPGTNILPPGHTITRISGLSADGNAIGVSTSDVRTTCGSPDIALPGGGAGVLYLNGTTPACGAPTLAFPIRNEVSLQYTPFGIALNAFVSGTWPLTYQWQREDPSNPGQWINLTEACSGFVFGREWNYEGVNKSQLRVGQNTCGNGRDGNYRVIVSNDCGTLTSDPASVTFTQGTVVTQQPEPINVCVPNSGFSFAVGVTSSSDLLSQWEIKSASGSDEFEALADGTLTGPDGRALDISGSGGQFLSVRPGAFPVPSAYLIRCVFLSPCGNTTSNAVALNIGGASCGSQCDTIDFNNNQVFPEDQDVIDYFSVLAGGECSTFFCNDIDFNNNFVFPEDQDVIDFFNVLAGGECL